MARTRVFVSSTYYDLKHIRASLDGFIESLGFESILSEKGGVTYAPDLPLDESCYIEVGNVDLFVIIIGGRYGSETSSSKPIDKNFYKKYESVTKREFEEAASRDTPIYILIDSSVYSEYQTYQKNRDNESIVYAHVDSINIFKFIEEILSKPKNNPIKSFEKFSDIENWLREQWSGLFRELLHRMSAQKQLSDLNSQVNELQEINSTLKSYLESLMRKIDPDKSDSIIKTESERLEEVSIAGKISRNDLARHIIQYSKREINSEEIISIVRKSNSKEQFLSFLKKKLLSKKPPRSDIDEKIESLSNNPHVIEDVNRMKEIIGLKEIEN
ncbi:DUF4062 domain-containing protein [Hoeflea sp. EC-HK425]|uniref:DUF4062 domain-containing protein n=1 Tax=Hoeflea sp. EC-HK425 TaxID=2038388 RepID=UPI00125FF276|nr:DUF4062 domain-containing protein [Hoeflea sp. EC-HK425]|tara:strand:- start:366 stop:1352 length:987 start_codon:yes stop_codon:yes gene_type:complete